MSEAIQIKGVQKYFGQKQALIDQNFTIERGEVVALLGPNGAGKSTMIHIILGLLQPTEGEVLVFNENPKKKQVRDRLGVMLQEVSLMDGLKVKELVRLFRTYYKEPVSDDQLKEWLQLSDDIWNTRTERLSGGQQRRVAVALALVGNPDVLFLDEPTVGMDIESRALFWKTIQELAAQGKTILFTTHYLEEAEQVAERILLFQEGQLIADASAKAIQQQFKGKWVSFECETVTAQTWSEWGEVLSFEQRGYKWKLVTDHPDFVVKHLILAGHELTNLSIGKGSFEQAFRELTKKNEGVLS